MDKLIRSVYSHLSFHSLMKWQKKVNPVVLHTCVIRWFFVPILTLPDFIHLIHLLCAYRWQIIKQKNAHFIDKWCVCHVKSFKVWKKKFFQKLINRFVYTDGQLFGSIRSVFCVLFDDIDIQVVLILFFLFLGLKIFNESNFILDQQKFFSKKPKKNNLNDLSIELPKKKH